MSEVFLTGATGNVGNAIARALHEKGRSIRALVRSIDRARACLPSEVELFEGDVTDADSVKKGMEGCSVVYHASGLPEQWLRDPALFQQVNAQGTRHMIDAALAQGVQNFLYTSTIDIFEFGGGKEFDETRIDATPKPTAYERSKQDGDRLVAEAVDRGLPARFLHPSGVYGPAPSKTPGINTFIRDLELGRVPMLLPGGFPIVYTDDVAAGHLLAEEKGPVGGRYILSESYWTLEDFAKAVSEAGPGCKIPKVMPIWVAKIVASLGEIASTMTGKPPLIAKGQLHFLTSEVRPSGAHAREAIGWVPRGLAEGLALTMEDFRQKGTL